MRFYFYQPVLFLSVTTAKLSTSPITLLGTTYKPINDENKHELTVDDFPGLFNNFRTKLWFTYRSGYQAISESIYRSDAGWGCMHRTGQMLLAQALLVHFLGRGLYIFKNSSIIQSINCFQLDFKLKRKGNEYDEIIYEILPYFEDVPTAFFSIHNITKIGELQNIRIGEWFTPGAICYALK